MFFSCTVSNCVAKHSSGRYEHEIWNVKTITVNANANVALIYKIIEESKLSK